MRVLAEIHTVFVYERKQFLEGSDLLLHPMATIVDEDVYAWNLLSQRTQETPVCLIPNKYLDPVFFQSLAVRIDVDPKHSALRPKIMLPHLQRSALRHAEFDDMNIGAPKPREVPLIDFEIVLPLVNMPARIFREVFFPVHSLAMSFPTNCPTLANSVFLATMVFKTEGLSSVWGDCSRPNEGPACVSTVDGQRIERC